MEDMVSTDEAILNNIGEGDESNTDENVEEQSPGTQENTGTETPATSSEQSADGSSNSEQQQQVNGPQDLVDASGNIIATGGKERRFYETAQREKLRADNASQELEAIRGQLEAVNNAGTVGNQYNLSPEEVTTGAQLIASYKDNPVETIQYMLTQAQSNGHNVDNIISGGTDMNAVKQMLDNALAPLVGDRQEMIETQEAENRASEIYNNFSTQHPDAAVHEDSLSRLLQQEPNLDVEAAYYKLQSFYAQRGLDWTKSLDTLQAEQTANTGSTINTQPQPPEGGSVSPTNVTDTAQVANVNVSTDDIIRQAMAEAGV
jgi:hypothetical protein